MEPTEQNELTRRRRERNIVIVVFLFIVLFTGIEIQLLRLSSKLPFVNSIFFFGLMNLNIVLIMLLLFLVFRNAVKLILDDRKGKIGSRLRTRLVLSFGLFAIIPTILMFSISAFYIKNSFDKWFNVRIGGSLEKSIQVAENYYENTKGNAAHFVRKIAFTLDAHPKPGKRMQRKLEVARLEYGLDAVEYYANPFSKRVISAHPDRIDKIPPASLETLQLHFTGANECRVQPVGTGEIVRCGAYLGVGRGVIFADYFIPMALASELAEISMTYQDYLNDNPANYPIKSTYFAILSMMTLLILFSAIWTGFYVARRLTVPIEELCKGTDEVAKGNLDYFIPSQGTAEMGRLVESFNHMTSDLKQSKRHVEATNAHLKQVNEELFHRRRYIEVLLESVESGVISLDEDGLISMVNPAASELLHINAEEIKGKPYWAIVPENQREEFRQTLAAVYGTAQPMRRELRIQTQSGETINLLVTLSVLRDQTKKQMGVVAVFDDITDIQKRQRMTAWREVAKRIAHEIKNPLTPIQLSVERLRRRYLDVIKDDGTFDKSTQIVLNEVDALKQLVSEFSSFARLPEIKQLPEKLNEIILEAVNLFRSAHEGIRFELNLEEGLPQMELDRSQLKRVLINLFDNAVAAMKNKGCIYVVTQQAKDRGHVLISVGDEGCGIPKGVEAQLFQPYFSTKSEGTGLGLAIVQRIIADHGGFVRVAHRKGGGTIFLIELPDSLMVKAKSGSVTASRESLEPPVKET